MPAAFATNAGCIAASAANPAVIPVSPILVILPSLLGIARIILKGKLAAAPKVRVAVFATSFGMYAIPLDVAIAPLITPEATLPATPASANAVAAFPAMLDAPPVATLDNINAMFTGSIPADSISTVSSLAFLAPSSSRCLAPRVDSISFPSPNISLPAFAILPTIDPLMNFPSCSCFSRSAAAMSSSKSALSLASSLGPPETQWEMSPANSPIFLPNDLTASSPWDAPNANSRRSERSSLSTFFAKALYPSPFKTLDTCGAMA